MLPLPVDHAMFFVAIIIILLVSYYVIPLVD